ncbi:MAG: DNA translocase FtsK 4TM domain-containing protein [Candidatus Komeilibacteria bacterium]|nr:DNA translocase FtsK 4TM domain-containing protein [Candidatus Komeilibacteria bacterium]
MAKKNKRKQRQEKEAEENGWERGPMLASETKKSILIIVLFALAALSILSFFDLAGDLGLALKNTLNLIFGWGALIAPVVLLILGYFLLLPEKYAITAGNYIGVFFLVMGYSGIFQFIKDAGVETFLESGQGGGYLGYFVYLPLQKTMGSWASIIVLLAIFLIAILLTFNTTLKSVAKKINFFNLFKNRVSSEKEEENWQEENDDWQESATEPAAAEEDVEETTEAELGEATFAKKKIGVAAAAVKDAKKPDVDSVHVTFSKNRNRKVEVPLNLLEGRSGKPTSGDIKANAEIIRNTLEKFGIPVEMDEVNVGPTVTQFTLKPAEGIKLSRIITLQNDLAMSLAAHPIRIEAPIPGKSLVGVEVPNQKIAIVKLKDIIASYEFQHKRGSLKIALGEDVSGKSWTVNLTSMPHLLIAGATGSGKSVCINNVIISLLYQYTPDQLKMLIVDPKKVELTNYNGIPHLLTPVITEVDKTINALRWAVKEMEERFKLLNSAGKRNIDAYNEAVLVNRLPYIVIIIDELADLMAVSSRDVEGAIVRLAQMARAVGIHLVVATQRPSVNVITGLIKANIPGRIAFAVASQVDSRTILDVSGAEKLLGKGDLLFSSAEISKPRRIQGAYLSDAEIERVIDFWKQQGEPDYNDEVVEGRSHGGTSAVGGSENGDELLEEAKDIVIKAGKASASLLQRRLRVGYARAARLLDLLEEQGVIGPGDGAKPREILISDQDFYHIPSETTNKYVSESAPGADEVEEEEPEEEAEPEPEEPSETEEESEETDEEMTEEENKKN